MPDYPVYEKNGQTQIAATAQREVELQYDGWRKQEPKPATSSGEGQADQTKQSKPSK